MKFRPCIDLHEGRVVQIVGGTLRDEGREGPVFNFRSDRSAADFAAMYRADGLTGGHVISLGPGNRDAVVSALRAFPGGLHAGGGITPANAAEYLDAGASHVIVTSYVFLDGRVDMDRLRAMVNAVGRDRLVLDVSCRRRDSEFCIVTDRWQKFTEVAVTRDTLGRLSFSCAEYLVHGVDVEGKQQGIEEELVELLGRHSPIPVTYAGGVKSIGDLDRVEKLGAGRVDVTIGSALDIFGGAIPYRLVVEWHRSRQTPPFRRES
jgi:phosphoribosylformimino-5-aminoimidazole carboxamide ribotide isomerase